MAAARDQPANRAKLSGDYCVCTRYMTLETIAPLSDDPIVSLPAVAA
jgi:hypothetical protein